MILFRSLLELRVANRNSLCLLDILKLRFRGMAMCHIDMSSQMRSWGYLQACHSPSNKIDILTFQTTNPTLVYAIAVQIRILFQMILQNTGGITAKSSALIGNRKSTSTWPISISMFYQNFIVYEEINNYTNWKIRTQGLQEKFPSASLHFMPF